MHKVRGNHVCAELENKKPGIRASVSCDSGNLPCFTEWIYLMEQDYVLGLEPGTHYPTGSAAAKEAGGLVSLLPGEAKTYSAGIMFEDVADSPAN